MAKQTKIKNKAKREGDEGLAALNRNAAGIDVGNAEHYVAVPAGRDPEPVQTFGSFTADLHRMAHWLKACGVDTVVMQATGVYWIALFQTLESYGFQVSVVIARHTKTLPGRKTDVLECQWLQKLHTFGLLNNSFHPTEEIQVLRTYLRQRENLVAAASTCIQHMQKTLTLMNVQLANVISDISGVTGMAILRAIVGGERDPDRLSTLKHNRVRASRQEIARSLEGNWREELLFVLEQSLELYDLYVSKIAMRSTNRTASENDNPEAGVATTIRCRRASATKTGAAFQPQGPTLPHKRRRFDEGRRAGGTNDADDPLGSRCGHEPLEHREAVCFLAWIVSGQPDQWRQSAKAWNAPRCESSGHGAASCGMEPHSKPKRFGSKLPQTAIQARCSQSDHSDGAQASQTDLQDDEVRHGIRGQRNDSLRIQI